MGKVLIVVEAETTEEYDNDLKEATLLRTPSTAEHGWPPAILGQQVTLVLGGLGYIKPPIHVKISAVMGDHQGNQTAQESSEAIPAMINDTPSSSHKKASSG